MPLTYYRVLLTRLIALGVLCFGAIIASSYAAGAQDSDVPVVLTAQADGAPMSVYFDADTVRTEADANAILGQFGATVAGFENYNGVAIAEVVLDPNMLATVVSVAQVADVVPSVEYQLFPFAVDDADVASRQADPPWHFDYLDEVDDGRYQSRYSGAGVHVYVVDGRLWLDEHLEAELGDRIGAGYDFIGDDNDPVFSEDADCPDGFTERFVRHSAQVAALAAGSTYGVARDVTVHPVAAFRCNGGAASPVIADALGWVLDNLELPAVVNLSFGGNYTGPPNLIEIRVEQLVDAGATVVVAAGNKSIFLPTDDACEVSPARVSSALTVGALNRDNEQATISIGGDCVDFWAPGVGVATSNGTNEASVTGTSFAAPMVAGLAAHFGESRPIERPQRAMSQLVLDTQATEFAGLGAATHKSDDPGSPLVRFGASCVDGTPTAELVFRDSTLPVQTFEVTFGDVVQSFAVQANRAEVLRLPSQAPGPVELLATKDGREMYEGRVLVPNCSGPSVTVAVSCLQQNGRIDTNVVNTTGRVERYSLQIGPLFRGQRTVDPGDWWRSPLTGRPDGDYLITLTDTTIGAAPSVVYASTVTVDCDVPSDNGTDEVQIINACRAGNGYILFQFANPVAARLGWVIEFEGVPNRSTSATGFAQAVRAVTGRPDGIHRAIIRRSGDGNVRVFDVHVACD